MFPIVCVVFPKSFAFSIHSGYKEYTVFHPAYPDSGGDDRLQAVSAVSGVCHDGGRGTGTASYDDRHCGILCAQSISQG